MSEPKTDLPVTQKPARLVTVIGAAKVGIDGRAVGAARFATVRPGVRRASSVNGWGFVQPHPNRHPRRARKETTHATGP